MVRSADKEVDMSLKRAERLRQTVLRKAFSGKLLAPDSYKEDAITLSEHPKAGETAFSGKGSER